MVLACKSNFDKPKLIELWRPGWCYKVCWLTESKCWRSFQTGNVKLVSHFSEQTDDCWYPHIRTRVGLDLDRTSYKFLSNDANHLPKLKFLTQATSNLSWRWNVYKIRIKKFRWKVEPFKKATYKFIFVMSFLIDLFKLPLYLNLIAF